MLITERPGRLRIVRDGVLDPKPISGLPPMHVRGLAGLLDVAVHPKFAENKLIYFSYVKDGERGAATAVFRGRLDGMTLSDVNDVFVSETWMKGNDLADGRFGSRIVFAKDGTLLITCGDRDRADGGQNPADDFGKVIRVNDDGTSRRTTRSPGAAAIARKSTPSDNAISRASRSIPSTASCGRASRARMAAMRST